MRKRLEELNWRTLPRSLDNGDRGEVVELFDSKPAEVVEILYFVEGAAEEEHCLKPTE